MSNAWQRQCAFPSSGYTSEKRGIWHDVKVGRDSEPRVTDRHASKGHSSDCRGNLIPRKASPARSWMLAKIAVEKVIDSLPREKRITITPARKWQAVEVVASGNLHGVAAMLV